MQPSSLSAPGPIPLQNPLGTNGLNPANASNRTFNPPLHGVSPSPSPRIPGPGIAPVAGSATNGVNGLNSRGSPTPGFPVPHRGGTVPSVSTTPPTLHPLRPIQSAPVTFPMPSIPLPVHPPAGSNETKEHIEMAGKVKALFDILSYPDGEIPIFDIDKHSKVIRSGPVATQSRDSPWWDLFGSGISWTDAYGILLEDQFLLLKEETSPTGVTKSSHVIRPILLEYLSLASFDDEPEVRKYPRGLFKRIGSRLVCSSAKKEPSHPMHPFTIYHVAAKITRRYTIYSKKGTERNKWNVDFKRAIEARKSQQDPRMLYEPQVLNDGFFKIAPRIQFTRGTHYTGRVVCAALFAFQGENYIAIGCTTGIYVSKRTIDYSFRKVLEFNEPNSIVAIPEFNKFIVHCELELYSYPLDKVVRASLGDAAYKDLSSLEEKKFAENHGEVLFLKAGRIVDRTGDQPVIRTVVIYAGKTPERVSSHVQELINLEGNPAIYKPLGPEMTIPDDPHDATCFHDKVAICTSKAIYFVEPTDGAKTSPEVVPKQEPKKSKKKKDDTPKIVGLVDKATVLGMATYEKDLSHKEIIIVYNDLGYFVDEAGKPARSTYYIEWERKATAFARRGPHLLLFSPGYIEVRNIETGKLDLVKMVGVNELRPLRSGLTEGRSLVGVMTGGAEDDGSRTEKLVELIYHGVDT